MEFLEYNGPLLNPNDMKDLNVKTAYISYREQRTRCYNKNRDKYKNYGKKGIEVKYTSRQFIGWWLSEIKKFNGSNPTISRINHDGHYEFGNIKIESRSENSIERNNRVGPHLKPKKTFVCSIDGSVIAEFCSISQCAKFFNTTTFNIFNLIRFKKNYKSFYFRH